jgi:ketosteroid isomerase-like protein
MPTRAIFAGDIDRSCENPETSVPMAAEWEVARTAMTRWQHGAASGDWSSLVAMLAPDVTFHVPVAGFDGTQHGVAAAERFFAYLTANLRAELTVTSPLLGGSRVGFEVDVAGTFHGKGFRQALCLVFAVRDGVVSSFSEYLAWPGGLNVPEAP